MQPKDRDIKAYYYDVLESIKHIFQFLDSFNIKTFDEYQANILVKSAVERKLEIIGEAINRVFKMDSTLPITDYRKIIDTRNFIIHQYDFVDDAQVWGILEKHLLVLKQQVENYLDSDGHNI
jgi:uncharacterized protein with HEPN domain